MPNTFLPQNGSYRDLRVYKITEIIYDYTYFFVQHYKERGDRTIDQMVQAARSGKTKHRGRQPGCRYLIGNGDQTDQCGESQFGGTTAGL